MTLSARTALKIPGLSAAATQMVVHAAVVFLAAFGAQLLAGATGEIHSWPTLLAVVTSCAAAGVTALIHYLLGLVPSPVPTTSGSAKARADMIGVSLKITGPLAQIFWSLVVVFLAAFGAQLAAAGSGIVSEGALVALVVSAVAAAVTAVVQAVLKIVPTPT